MSASKGWRTKVVIQGSPQDEEMQGSPSEATQTTFYTLSFPVVDTLGNITDDEDEVTVYVDSVAQASADFTLTGASGKIVFDTAPGAGKEVTIDYSYKHTLAYGFSGVITIDGGLEEIHVWGLRTPKEILEGAVKIKGSLERFFVSRDFVGKVALDPDGDVGQADFYLYLYPLGEVVGKPYYSLGGVKFGPWNLTLPDPDSPITERLEWTATSITPGTVS